MRVVRVLGVGQAARGDDGVGLEVARVLREREPPVAAEVHAGVDPARVVELLDGARRVLLVDAVVAPGRVGQAWVQDPDAFQGGGGPPVSSHGMGLVEAVELARCLYPGGVAPEIRVLVVGIEEPGPMAQGLSPTVAAAVPAAVARALAWIEEDADA